LREKNFYKPVPADESRPKHDSQNLMLNLMSVSIVGDSV